MREPPRTRKHPKAQTQIREDEPRNFLEDGLRKGRRGTHVVR